MTIKQAVKILKADETDDSFDWDELGLKGTEDFNRAWDEAYDMAIQALEESRNITNEELHQDYIRLALENERLYFKVKSLQERLQKGVTITDFADKCIECGKTKRCKDCKYFEYDSVAKVDGIPLIVSHEICNRWGDGCKTKEDGYCFLFESKEESEVNADADCD